MNPTNVKPDVNLIQNPPQLRGQPNVPTPANQVPVIGYESESCPWHPDRQAVMYCVMCGVSACRECGLSHQGITYNSHKCMEIAEALKKHVPEALDLIPKMEVKLESSKEVKMMLSDERSEIDKQYSTAEAEICDAAKKLQEYIEQWKHQHIQKLRSRREEKLASLDEKLNQVEKDQKAAEASSEKLRNITWNNSVATLKTAPATISEAKQLVEEFNPNTLKPVVSHRAHSMTFVNAATLQGQVLELHIIGKGHEEGVQGQQSFVCLRADFITGEPFDVQVTAELKLPCGNTLILLVHPIFIGILQSKGYGITYCPSSPMLHQLCIRINGKDIRGSPFTVTVSPRYPMLPCVN